MSARILSKYLATSMMGSAVLSAAHGWMTTHNTGTTFNQGLHGLFIGAWAPIVVPYMLFSDRCKSSACPIVGGRHPK